MPIPSVPFDPNETNACIAIKQYEDSRPPITAAARTASTVVFAFLSALCLLLVWLCWVYRHSIRMRKIRPFKLSASLLLNFPSMGVCLLLNPVYTGIPCWYFYFCFAMAAVGISCNIFLKLVVFTLASRSAILGKEDFVNISQDQDDLSTSNMSRKYDPRLLDSWVKFFKVWISASKSLDSLSLDDIHAVSHNLVPVLSVAGYLIGFIPFFAVTFSYPAFYQGCTGCSMYAELFYWIAFQYLTFSLLGVRAVWLSRGFPDPHGIMLEGAICILLSAPIMIFAIVIYFVDPGMIHFNRVFLGDYAMLLGPSLIIAVSIVYELVRAWQAEREFARLRKEPEDPRMSSASQSQRNSKRVTLWEEFTKTPEIKEEFEQYCTRLYAGENFQFVEDVKAYKHYFIEKNSGWRKHKAKLIYSQYIEDGTAKEINISENLRSDIKRRLHQCINNSQLEARLETLFDSAVEDVLYSILQSLWLDFERKRNRGHKGRAAHWWLPWKSQNQKVGLSTSEVAVRNAASNNAGSEV